jgi:hypothetical protein
MYNAAKQYILDGTVDLDTTTFHAKLVSGASAALVSDYTRDTFASCGAKLANSNLLTLTAVSVTVGASAKASRWDVADMVFTASGGNISSCQYVVIGVSTGKAICWSKLSTAAFTVSQNNTLTVTINASGVFELTGMVT